MGEPGMRGGDKDARITLIIDTMLKALGIGEGQHGRFAVSCAQSAIQLVSEKEKNKSPWAQKEAQRLGDAILSAWSQASPKATAGVFDRRLPALVKKLSAMGWAPKWANPAGQASGEARINWSAPKPQEPLWALSLLRGPKAKAGFELMKRIGLFPDDGTLVDQEDCLCSALIRSGASAGAIRELASSRPLDAAWENSEKQGLMHVAALAAHFDAMRALASIGMDTGKQDAQGRFALLELLSACAKERMDGRKTGKAEEWARNARDWTQEWLSQRTQGRALGASASPENETKARLRLYGAGLLAGSEKHNVFNELLSRWGKETPAKLHPAILDELCHHGRFAEARCALPQIQNPDQAFVSRGALASVTKNGTKKERDPAFIQALRHLRDAPKGAEAQARGYPIGNEGSGAQTREHAKNLINEILLKGLDRSLVWQPNAKKPVLAGGLLDLIYEMSKKEELLALTLFGRLGALGMKMGPELEKKTKASQKGRAFAAALEGGQLKKELDDMPVSKEAAPRKKSLAL